MQKIYILSCCAECPSHKIRKDWPYCERQGLLVEEDSKDFNLTLMGFPEWCPLDTMESSKMIDYKKEVKQIMQIMQIMPDDFSQDELLEASHYLNRVIETAKKAKAG